MNMATAATKTTMANSNMQVLYFDGQKPVGQPATLIWSERTAKLIGQQADQQYVFNQLRVSPRVGSADRFIALPDGGQLQCPDQTLLNKLPQESKTEDLVAWLERRWDIAIGCVAAMAACLISGYFYGLPAAAEYVALRVPLSYEVRIGEQGLKILDDQAWFQASQLPPEMRQRISDDFKNLVADLPIRKDLHLEFRHASPFIGANAFALPGGTIVITDQMVELTNSPGEVSAILAHEVGHVEMRHTLRHILQDSAAALIAATLTADAASMTLVVTGLPTLLLQASYSRQFESDADEFAFKLLKKHGYTPALFANIMERLENEKHAKSEKKGLEQEGLESDPLSFLSSHPVTRERVARARAAAIGTELSTQGNDAWDWGEDKNSDKDEVEVEGEDTGTIGILK